MDACGLTCGREVVPHLMPGEGGKIQGFTLIAVDPRSLYQMLTLKVNDVLKEVNDKAVSGSVAKTLYNSLRVNSQTKILIERDGHNLVVKAKAVN